MWAIANRADLWDTAGVKRDGSGTAFRRGNATMPIQSGRTLVGDMYEYIKVQTGNTKIN